MATICPRDDKWWMVTSKRKAIIYGHQHTPSLSLKSQVGIDGSSCYCLFRQWSKTLSSRDRFIKYLWIQNKGLKVVTHPGCGMSATSRGFLSLTIASDRYNTLRTSTWSMQNGIRHVLHTGGLTSQPRKLIYLFLEFLKKSKVTKRLFLWVQLVLTNALQAKN